MVTRTHCSMVVVIYAVLVMVSQCWTTAQAFLVRPSPLPVQTVTPVPSKMMMMVPMTTTVLETTTPVVLETITTSSTNKLLATVPSYNVGSESLLNQGVRNYYHHSQAKTTLTTSSSMLVSLEPIKKVTAEEIQAKKSTFNLIFWGGGFVAPFVATVFYFGFKFWEK